MAGRKCVEAVIIEHASDLLSSLSIGRKFCSDMEKDKIIDGDEHKKLRDLIEAKDTDAKNSYVVHEILKKKSESKFRKFITLLEGYNQEDTAELLIETLEKVKAKKQAPAAVPARDDATDGASIHTTKAVPEGTYLNVFIYEQFKLVQLSTMCPICIELLYHASKDSRSLHVV